MSGIPVNSLDPGTVNQRLITDREGKVVWTDPLQAVYRARGVCFSNHSLTAFTVATNTDGITYVAGDIVLLAAQTTAADCGLYVVGTVATTAPLTRLSSLPFGATYQNGTTVEIQEGTIYKRSTWKTTATGAVVIGTTDPAFYPRVCKGTLTLASGTYTLGSTEGFFLLSTTTSPINLTLNTVGGTVTSTVGLRAVAASRTAGKSATGAAIVLAIVAAGTINTADNSTVDWLVTNW